MSAYSPIANFRRSLVWETDSAFHPRSEMPPAGPQNRAVMAFIQSMEFATEQRETLVELIRRWSADAIGNGTAKRATLAEDRSVPNRFVLAVAFESADEAAKNSDRSETGAFAEQFTSLCSDGPSFREFDVVEVYGD